MKELLLIRHAKSSWNSAEHVDFDRPLNSNGERDATMMGQILASQGLYPAHIIASPARRAQMTAIAIAEAIGFPVEAIDWQEVLYLADSDTLLAQIRRTHSSIKRLALIAHNPGLTELVNRLAAPLGTSIGNLPTCGIARFQMDIQAWPQAKAKYVVDAAFDGPKQHRPTA